MYWEGEQGEQSQEFAHGPIVFGREPECEVTVNSSAVSRRHAVISEAGSHWVLRDLGSTNGTWLDGRQVQSSERRIVRDGDLVQVADHRVEVRVQPDDSPRSPNFSRSLLIFMGDRFQSEFPLGRPGTNFIVGGPNGHIFVEGSLQEAEQLIVTAHDAHLELSTSQGNLPVLVNGLAVRGETPLADADEIHVGPYHVIVNAPEVHAAQMAQGHSSGGSGSRPAMNKAVRPWDEGDSYQQDSGRKFILQGGGLSEDDETLRTTVLPVPPRGFETNTSRRFSQNEGPDPRELAAMRGNKIILGLLVTFLLLLMFLGAFLIIQMWK